MKTSPGKLSRRSFLLAAGAGGAAATAAVVSKTTSKATPSTQAPPADSRGYQVTEHVQNYYRTTRI
jgi:hypothetical protein